MKTLEVYVRKEWIDQNTSRQRYRALTYQDPLSMLTKSAKAIPAIGLAGAGMGKNLANQSLSLSNYGLHTLKEVHNGIANVGKNEDCRFNTPVDMSGQKELKKAVDLHGALPFSKIFIVTDDNVSEDLLDRGVIFHSNTEATRFAGMYTSLDDYMASDFYKEPSKLVSVIINRKDLSVFKMEMSAYLHQRENSWKSAFLVVPELNAHSFKFTDNEDGTYRIDFPKDISRKEYLKYFKQTNEASLESNPSSDIELSEIKQPKNKWQSFSDSEKEKEKETESEELSSDSEEIPEEEELNSRGRVLASSMEKGEFQAERNPHLEEENTQDASDELRNPGVRPTP